MRPGSSAEIYKYIEEVARKFDRYVEQEILTKLSTPNLNQDQVLTGLQFIQTRGLSNFQATVIQLLTTYYVGKRAKEVYESGLRAAEWYGIAPRTLARALASTMLSKAHVQRDRLYEQALQEMARPAALVMLDMIQPQRKPNVRRRLVNLIRRAGNVKPPYPSPRWAHSSEQELTAMKQAWEKLIDPSGAVRESIERTKKPLPPETQPRPASDAEEGF